MASGFEIGALYGIDEFSRTFFTFRSAFG